MISPRNSLLTSLLVLTALTACGDSVDGWFIISNPSQGGLTIGVVKDSNHSTMELIQTPGGSEAFLVRESIAGRVREQYYAVSCDTVVEKQEQGILVESPAFPSGRRTFPAQARLTLGQDQATLMILTAGDAGEASRDVWWISAWCNMAIHQHANGITVHRAGRSPQELGPGATIQARGKSYQVSDRFGKLLLLQPGPPPDPEKRMAYVDERQSIQFFDVRGKVIAELPAEGIEIAPAGRSVFLTGLFPQGLAGVSDRPFSVLMPLHNHHLILLTR